MSFRISLQLLTIPLLLFAMSCAVQRSNHTDTRTSQNDLRNTQIISLLGRPLRATPRDESRGKLQDDLVAARRESRADPRDPGKIVWVGRRLGYLWQINEAIELYSQGIKLHPDYAPFYRHRGHRYISLRRFDEAITDMERAADLIENRPDQIEQDGMPNARGIPLTTLGFNVWYHLGLARYLTQDFEGALAGFKKAESLGRGYDDNLAATTDWMYMALRRLGRDREAKKLLDRIHEEMEIIENQSYHRRLLMYKGLISPDELLELDKASDLDMATLGYGLGNWYLYNGDSAKAQSIFSRVTSGPHWSAFGFIASEVELAGLTQTGR